MVTGTQIVDVLIWLTSIESMSTISASVPIKLLPDDIDIPEQMGGRRKRRLVPDHERKRVRRA